MFFVLLIMGHGKSENNYFTILKQAKSGLVGIKENQEGGKGHKCR